MRTLTKKQKNKVIKLVQMIVRSRIEQHYHVSELAEIVNQIDGKEGFFIKTDHDKILDCIDDIEEFHIRSFDKKIDEAQMGSLLNRMFIIIESAQIGRIN